jgi:hypothetical protein
MNETNTLVNQQPPLPPPVYYLPLAVDNSTAIAKTILMAVIVGHGLLTLLYVCLLLSAIGGSRVYGNPETQIMGCLILVVWFGGWGWLAVLGYKSILRLRQECLAAKTRLYQAGK